MIAGNKFQLRFFYLSRERLGYFSRKQFVFITPQNKGRYLNSVKTRIFFEASMAKCFDNQRMLKKISTEVSKKLLIIRRVILLSYLKKSASVFLKKMEK